MKNQLIRILLLLLLVLSSVFSQAQNARLLQSGPMVGYADMQEVLLWAQTTEPAEVQFTYHELNQANPVFLTENGCTSYLPRRQWEGPSTGFLMHHHEVHNY